MTHWHNFWKFKMAAVASYAEIPSLWGVFHQNSLQSLRTNCLHIFPYTM
jgi:hypothetical protein